MMKLPGFAKKPAMLKMCQDEFQPVVSVARKTKLEPRRHDGIAYTKDLTSQQ